MRKITSRLFGVSAMLTAVILLFSACSMSDLSSALSGGEAEKPKAVALKTDLHDASFSFTYGELKTVLPAEQLASLFEYYEERTDDTEIRLSYNELYQKFRGIKIGGESLFDRMMNLLSAEEKALLSANSSEVLSYFNACMNTAKQARPVVKYGETLSVDSGSIHFSQNGKDSDPVLSKAAGLYKDLMLRGMEGVLKSGTTEAGTDLTDILYLSGRPEASLLTDADVVSVISSLSTVYSSNEVADETRVPTEMTRTVVITLRDSSESVEKAFSLHNKQSILKEMEKAKDCFTVSDYALDFSGCTITAVFNAVTDEVLSVTYDKHMTVKTRVTGIGSLEMYGTQDVAFDCRNRMEYQFGWNSAAK